MKGFAFDGKRHIMCMVTTRSAADIQGLLDGLDAGVVDQSDFGITYTAVRGLSVKPAAAMHLKNSTGKLKMENRMVMYPVGGNMALLGSSSINRTVASPQESPVEVLSEQQLVQIANKVLAANTKAP